MNKIDKKEIERLAVLSRLRLSGKETDDMAAHMENMVRFLSVIEAVDTTTASPTAHILSAVNVLREDAAVRETDRETLLSYAPKTDGEAFIVPLVLE